MSRDGSVRPGAPTGRWGWSALAGALLLTGGTARAGDAEEAEIQALLRVASAQSAIIVFCAKHHAVDGTRALRISQTSRDVADKVLGHERANAAFKEELARRYDEVKAAGEEAWCDAQRAAMRADNNGIFRD